MADNGGEELLGKVELELYDLETRVEMIEHRIIERIPKRLTRRRFWPRGEWAWRMGASKMAQLEVVEKIVGAVGGRAGSEVREGSG